MHDEERLKELAERNEDPSLLWARWLHLPVTQGQFDTVRRERNDERETLENMTTCCRAFSLELIDGAANADEDRIDDLVEKAPMLICAADDALDPGR